MGYVCLKARNKCITIYKLLLKDLFLDFYVGNMPLFIHEFMTLNAEQCSITLCFVGNEYVSVFLVVSLFVVVVVFFVFVLFCSVLFFVFLNAALFDIMETTANKNCNL